MPETVHDFDLAIVTGFGDKGVHELEAKLVKSLEPKSSRVIPGCPWYKALKHPDTLVQQLNHQIGDLYADRLLLVGHSYGALLALTYAMRVKMHNILALILIDGPLNLQGNVQPTKIGHRLFATQYKHRPNLADYCMREVRKLDDASSIMTIGNEHDHIVPFETKSIPGGHRVAVRELHGEATFIRTAPDGRPYNFILPDSMKGHGLHRKIPLIANLLTKIAPETARTSTSAEEMMG